MKFNSYITGSDDDGRRLDKVIKCIISNNNTPISKLLRKNLIRVNNSKSTADYRVKEGDIIAVASFLISSDFNINKDETSTGINTSSSFYPETIFKNEYLWIINKPYNISVQPGSDGSSNLATLMASITKKSTNSISFKIGPLHRLDRMTTGLLAFSQNLIGAHWFSEAIAQKESNLIQKTYIGIVKGNLCNNTIWKNTIIESPEQESSFHTVKCLPYGTDNIAITKAFPLEHGQYKNNPVTLVQFDILTGKKHQIRAQSAYNGYPLLGDEAYGGGKISEERQFYLHAIRLRFSKDNPVGLPQELYAPLSQEFKFFLLSVLINWNGSLII